VFPSKPVPAADPGPYEDPPLALSQLRLPRPPPTARNCKLSLSYLYSFK